MQATKTIEVKDKKISTMNLHSFAPVVAFAADSPKVTVMNTKGETLHHIKYHDGFLAQRIGPVCALGLHPLRLLLARILKSPLYSCF
jgi:regulator-associated protein of mTOR